MSEYNNDELLHYGVPGMRWGKRKAVPLSPAQVRVAKAKAAYKAANKQYDRDYKQAYRYSQNHMISQFFGKNKKTSDSNWEKSVKSAKAADKAKKAYKQAKKDAKSLRKANKIAAKKIIADAKLARKKRDSSIQNQYDKSINSIEKNYKRGQMLSKKDQRSELAADNKALNDWAKSKKEYKKEIARAKALRRSR